MRALFILSVFLLSGNAFCQDSLRTIKISKLGEPNDFSHEKKWDYFLLNNTIAVKIIDHLPAPAYCGVLATASITIVLAEKGDTIRVIDMCNVSNKYKKGQTIKIAPDDKPPFGLTTPFTLIENPNTKKLEPSEFDLTVLKTTWGTLCDM